MARRPWVQRNNEVFKSYMTEHKFLLEQRLSIVCQTLAEDVKIFIEAFDEMDNMPVDTGNLADGTGVGVYINGALRGYVPAQIATEPQNDKGRGLTNIWGTEYLQAALSESTSKFAKGIWVVLFSTVPYAVRVDSKGTVKKRGKNKGATKTPAGFFSTTLRAEMLKSFKTAFAREFPNVASKMKSI